MQVHLIRMRPRSQEKLKFKTIKYRIWKQSMPLEEEKQPLQESI